MSTNPFFELNLKASLTLESDGKEAKLFSGNIERINLQLHSYGHLCSLKFFAFENDDIDQMMTGQKIIKVTLTLNPTSALEGTEPLLEVKGILTHKCFKRVPSHMGQEEVPHRAYEIHFLDNAQATWREHHPTNIYVDESMKDVIEKHVNPEVTLKYEWDPIETKKPITAFSLEHKHWLPSHEQTNFYSFLTWYLNQENGILSYDHKKHDYTITGKKKEPEGDPLKVPEWCVNPPICIFPEAPRFNHKTIKHTSHTLDSEDKENPHAFKSVRRETIDHKNYRVYPDQASEKIQSSLVSEKNEIDVEFLNLEKEIQLNKLTPGSYLSFFGIGEGNWSRDACFKDKNFRVRNLYFEATSLGVAENILKDVQVFRLYVRAKLEEEDETFVERPNFIPPVYPFYIQGKIFSDVGDEPQKTHKIHETEEAPQGQYSVLVPLAGADKKVVAPFVPAYSSQFYFPLCKDAEVMLSMHFRTANIDRPIGWESLVRLAAGIQGNQIVFASNGQHKYTLMRHEYVDGKDPVFTIQHSTSENEKETIQIKDKEKEIFLNIDNKDKTSTTAQFNQDLITLSIDDKEASSTMQFVFDRKAKSMKKIVKDSEGTTEWLQTPTSIEFKCKEFKIESETINLTAKDNISLNGKNKIDNTTKIFNAAASAVNLG
jgi:hypothetical protein